MKYLFYIGAANARKNNWNGEIMRYGGVGVSGTEQSCVYYAEQLAQCHSVTLYAANCVTSTIRNVTYTNQLSSFDSDYDAIVVTYPFDLPNQCFVHLKTLYLYFQCNTFHEYNLSRFKHIHPWCKIVAVHVSRYGLESTRHTTPTYDRYITEDIILSNPIFTDVFDQYPIQKIPRSIIFHAVWERGGDVVEKVRQALNWSLPILTANYDTQAEKKSCDKSAVAQLLAKADYFIYPLINSNPLYYDVIHKDTFGCCVSEAMYMRVVVVTWRVAALAELYTDDEVVFVDFPEEANQADLIKPIPIMRDPALRSEKAIQNIVKAIQQLEANPSRKKKLLENAYEKVKNKFTALEWCVC